MSKKKENLDRIIQLIQENELTFKDLQEKTEIAAPTLYRYISELKEENAIAEDETKIFFIPEEEKKIPENEKLLEMILKKTLLSVTIKRILTISKEEFVKNEKSGTDKCIKTIVVEFNQRGYEKEIAEFLFDKYFREITLITVGVGGLIIYLRKNNKKSKVYSFFANIANCENEEYE